MPVLVRILAVLAVTLPLPPAVFGASGEEIHKTHCALCHDSGATQATRVGQPNDWRHRVEKGRAALLRSALECNAGGERDRSAAHASVASPWKHAMGASRCAADLFEHD